MKWMILNPREYELVMRPVVGIGPNQTALREVQARLRPDGELQMPETLFEAVKESARFWKGGYEKPLKAVLQAAERHA